MIGGSVDGKQFDRVIRSLHVAAPRRRALVLLLGGALGLAGHAHSDGKGKKKKVTLCLNGQTMSVKKNKKRSLLGQGATQGACAASPPPPPRPGSPPTSPPPIPPPPPGPSCADGIKNGTETDVDCGGSCQRCGTARICLRDADCLSGYCASGRCLPCQDSGDCDGAGNCFCSDNGICGDSGAFRFVNVPSCNFCPEETVKCVFYSDGGANNGVLCYPRCGEPFPE